MENFELLSGIASILGFIISIIVFFKITKIEKKITQSHNKVGGDMAGRDITKNS